MEWLGVVGIFAALVFFVVAAMRGYNVMITAPVTAAIIVLTNQLDFTQFYLTDPSNSYLAGIAAFVKNNLPIFVLSALFGKYIDASGAAKSIATTLMSKVGKNSAFGIVVGVGAVTALLTYGGISLFVVMFAIIPMARPLFKELNLPWHLFVASFALGACSFTMTMIPGAPSAANVVAANGCGVTVTSAPVLGIVGCVITIALSLVYIKFAIKRAQAKGEVYDCKLPESTYSTDNLPGIGKSIAPIIVLIGIILVGSAFKVPNIVYIAMIVGILLSAVLFHKNIGGNHKAVLGDGAKDSLGPTMFTAVAAGIGTIIAISSGFSVIQEAIFNMPGGPLVSGAVLTGVLGGVIGGGTAAIGIVMNNFVGTYLATGVSAAAFYKIIEVAAGIGGALPNAGSMFGMLNAMGLDHKSAYKHFFWISIVAELVALIVMIALASFGIE